MSLRGKTFTILFFISLLSILFSYYTNGLVLLPTINTLEDERSKINVERLISAIDEATVSLSQVVADYATWDDSYEYITAPYQEYVDTNLTEQTFENLKVHFMVYLNQEGEVIYNKLVTSDDQWQPTEFPDSLFSSIKDYPTLTSHVAPDESTKGIILTELGPAYAASHPITTSFDEGPVRGTLIMGRFLNESEVARLTELTKLTFSVIPPDAFTSQHQEVLSQATADKNVYSTEGTAESTIGIGFVRDINNQPAFFVELALRREFFQHGRYAQLLGTIINAIFTASLGLILYILFTRFVLGKLMILARELEEIAQKKNFSVRLSAKGKDEVARIAQTVNIFLEATGKYQHSFDEKAQELAQQVDSTSRQNESLENTKKAMLNLLEDARGLEGQLRRERDRAQGIITSMTEGLFVVDTNFALQLINPMACKMLSLDSKQVLGKNVADIVPLLKESKVLAQEDRPLWKTIKTGIPTKGDIEDKYKLKTIAKEIPIAFATAPLTTDGKIVGALVTFHDVTHQLQEKEIIEHTVEERTRELRDKNEALARAQKEISHGWMQVQREKARLTASINSLQLGFILTDQTEGIFMINAAALKVLGLQSQVYHISEMDTITGGAFALHEMLTRCASTKEQITKKDILLNSKYINCTVTPVLLEGPEREFLGTVVTLEDITEFKVTQRARDEFFSIASHELRTPLTAIRGNTAMINDFFADTLRDKKELKEMIDDIYSSSVRLIQIVNDFLNVSRLEMGKIEFKKSSVDIIPLIETVNKELNSTAEEKHLSLAFESPSQKFPHAYADADRVKEVLINLVGNAIKYTEKGGVSVGVSAETGRVKVLIKDSGTGISKENWDLLFRKFQQAGNSLLTRDTKRSTGLGLYIAKLMVEGMGGSIYLESSEVGKGSVFAFTLPVSPAQTDNNASQGGPVSS